MTSKIEFLGRSERARWLYLGLAFAAIVAIGSVQGVFMRQVIGVAFLYAVLAISLDLAWGYMGILSMGHAVFFGVGGYALGLLSVSVTSTGIVGSRHSDWWTFPLALLVGVAAAAALAALVGWFAFSAKRATPFYIAVVTLALTVIVSTFLDQAQRLGGQQGLSGFRIEWPGSLGWFLISGGVLAVAGVLGYRLTQSDFGRLMRAVRDNEVRCRYLGFNVERAKLVVFSLSAAVAGLAGVLYGGYVGFVSPPFVGFLFATEIIIWVAVGGRATLWGPIAGAMAISIGGAQLSGQFPFVWVLILGAIFVAVVAFIPDGLLPAGIRLWLGIRHRGKLTRLGHTSEIRIVPQGRAHSPVRDSKDRRLEIADVHRAYGSLQVLRGVSFEARTHELLCVVGPNGAGKSTLLGAITDGSGGYTGTIHLVDEDTVDLNDLTRQQIVQRGIARKFQTPNLFESLTVGECLLLATQGGRWPSWWRRSVEVSLNPATMRIVEAADLQSYLGVTVADLPHGVLQAVELAVTVSLNPKVLLLDEPTAGLTSDERTIIGGILRTLVAEGIIVILIEHDFGFVRSIADRLIVLHDGTILLDGSVQEVASSTLLRDVYLGSAHEAAG
ncbi:MAG: ATP-binding cassette domain-containing protein [Acidimicrobiia bacterium]